MTRYAVPSCTHVGPGRCRTTRCRYHEPRAHRACTIAHAERHGPQPFGAVGRVLGLSHEGARLIAARALVKVRRGLDVAAE